MPVVIDELIAEVEAPAAGGPGDESGAAGDAPPDPLAAVRERRRRARREARLHAD
jgi:hypothetical protein